MTVIRKKKPPRANESEDNRASTETGIRYTCECAALFHLNVDHSSIFDVSSCSADISHTVRIRCAQLGPPLPPANGASRNGPISTDLVPVCEDFDLCGTCFCDGKELGRHKRWHDYRVVEQHAYPIFVDDWGADEELLLIDACQTYGLGNWADIADHIGSYRNKEEVEAHYLKVYVASKGYPIPKPMRDLDTDQERFQARKKARLEKMQATKPPLPAPKPLASAPTSHEVAGFMPGRLEFEHEFENDAETLIKDMEFGLVMRFGGDEQPGKPPDGALEIKVEPKEVREGVTEEAPPMEEEDAELDLKLAILDIYSERYDRRVDAKQFIFDRALTDYKRIHTGERKRTKEERDLMNRVKVFARLQTSADNEAFKRKDELMLRKRIQELQEYRRMGLTTLNEAERYERDKQARINARQSGNLRDSLFGSRGRGPGGGRLDSREGTPSKPASRKTNQPLTFASSASLQLLTQTERQLCAALRILPKPFLFIKQTLLREYARREGRLRKTEARDLLHIDDIKLEAIWDLVIGVDESLQEGGSSQAVMNFSPSPVAEEVSQQNGVTSANVMDVDSPIS